MKRILRQQDLNYLSQKKYNDGHYRFDVEKSDRFPLGQAYIIDINVHPVASDFKIDVYTRKDSDELDQDAQHYALVNSVEHILLENESPTLLEDSFSDYLGILPLKEYKAKIESYAERIPDSIREGEKS